VRAGGRHLRLVADFHTRRPRFHLPYFVTGKLQASTPTFSYDQYNFGLQDSWDLTPKLNLLYGVRADLYRFRTWRRSIRTFVHSLRHPSTI